MRQSLTGVPGLDEILDRGLPESSCNIIASSPGCGKTTLIYQFIFANAVVLARSNPERVAHSAA